MTITLQYMTVTGNDLYMLNILVGAQIHRLGMYNCVYVFRSLLKMFNEIHYCDRLLFEIPHYITEVYQRREELHNLRENVLLVAGDYNRSVWLTETESSTN